jgi:hypothetical protein
VIVLYETIMFAYYDFQNDFTVFERACQLFDLIWFKKPYPFEKKYQILMISGKFFSFKGGENDFVEEKIEGLDCRGGSPTAPAGALQRRSCKPRQKIA